MELIYKYDCENIAWEEIPKLLEMVDMAFTETDIHKHSFEASHAVVFVFDNDKLIACGRMLSDGVRQSAIYDIAVNPSYQGLKIGQAIVSKLIATTPNCNVILYASPGKEEFYKKLKFKRMKTGMALFSNPQRMIDRGFVEE